MNYGKHSTKRLEKQADAKSTKIRKKFGIGTGDQLLTSHIFLTLLYYTPKKSNASIGDVQQEKRITRLSLLQ